ncbi:MAG: prolyl oligopeptidase family serine peptidase [Chitinophagaceae bacterium]|nr:prolyl oligopeptidase family serine peptidase [Chitinophagaceae bacterium]
MKKLFFLSLLLISLFSMAQESASYKLPPKEIADLLLAKPTPAVSIDHLGEWMLIMERESYPTVEELGQPELRVAGLRLNPNNYSPSRQSFINNLKLKHIADGKEYAITGIPAGALISNTEWSPSEKKISFTNTTATKVDLYVIDIAKKTAVKINKTALVTTIGPVSQWVDDNTIIYTAATKPAAMLPKRPITPVGPSIQENIGKAAPSRTYQDLIKSVYDETAFAFMTTAQLIKNTNGTETKLSSPAIYASFVVSPDNKYILTETIQKPYSYLVTAYSFASTMAIMDMGGKMVKSLAKIPSGETTPSGYDNVLPSPRGFAWRADEPSTITWCEPQDSGLIKKNMEFHDAVYALKAPFTASPAVLVKTKMRFRNIVWGNEHFAWVNEGLTGKQLQKASKLDPATGAMETLFERNTTDAYNNPGMPVMKRTAFGTSVINLLENNKILMNNPVGSSPDGDLPFLSTFDLSSKTSQIVWRAKKGSYETITAVLDANTLKLITRKESQTEVPNYYIKNLKGSGPDQQITGFSNPYPSMVGVTKEKLKYKRADGVDLTGDLYLPRGYDRTKDGPLPVLIWAYPREYNNAADAAQVRGSADRFTTISWGSPIFYVMRGYAVLDNAEMPIVAASKESKPNDTFIEQLKLNAEAAIGALTSLGVGDPKRVAVGGHSYGAFMTAHLLSHTNLFKAGLARSGAYNRTLTPFGFQAEERTYWESPDLYYKMSPFSYANKIKTPILLVHGEADDNPGTFPINSERLYNAIKGHGGTVRLVYLPYEAHGYRGKENLLHLLWEQSQWLDRFVKNAK